MKFTELMVLHSSPVYWNDTPPNTAPANAKGLHDFLLDLLDADKAGACTLYVVEPDRNRSAWLDPDAACQWVRTTFASVWRPGAEAIEGGTASSEAVYDNYVRHRAEVFLDDERLRACGGTAGAEWTIPPHTCLGMSIDWAYDHNWLWFTPQLRISNYWPHSPEFAPPRPPEREDPAPASQEQAAETLFDLYCHNVYLAFEAVRLKYLKTTWVTLELTPEAVAAPLYFYARPQVMPAAPEDFLAAANLAVLQKFSRAVAGVQDLLAADVSGALLQGNVLAFRREQRFPYEGAEEFDTLWQSSYLLVPWFPAETGEWLREVESEATFVADQLSFAEFIAGGQRHMDLLKTMKKPIFSMQHLATSVTHAMDLATRLQRQVVFEVRPRIRRSTYEVVEHLRSSLSRLGLSLVLNADRTSLSKEDEWHRVTEQVIRRVRHALTIRSLPHVNALTDSLENSRAHVGVKAFLESWTRDAQQIQADFRNAETSLGNMLEQERRERQERETEHQHLITYGLAALAAVGAFPLLVGQASWAELQTTMEQWPSPWIRFSPAYVELHPLLTLVAVVSASVLIAVLFFLLLKGMFQWEKRSSFSRELRRTGARLVRLERDMHRATSDVELCQDLISIFNWCVEKLVGVGDAPPANDLAAIRNQVGAFVILTEMKTRLPVPGRLPKALCLCRFVFQPVESVALTDAEFDVSLERCGVSYEGVQAIREMESRCRGNTKEWPSNFVAWVMATDLTQLSAEPAAAEPPTAGPTDAESEPSGPGPAADSSDAAAEPFDPSAELAGKRPS